ncbi:hypothetical protein Daus18300_005047 [Diaporthe australafricana]|uniref:Uncharacterized protein n=1 Tax=Diaporthe australafricana TaxID=127596 RepID=A0ABR3X4X8_9PEZI
MTPPFWQKGTVSDPDKETVKRFVYSLKDSPPKPEESSLPQEADKPETTSSLRTASESPFRDEDVGSWQATPNTTCHASFGDQGATATVGAFGQLLQFSQYLGAGSSGIFSVDHIGVHKPCQVLERQRDIQKLSQQPFHFGPTSSEYYGLRFPDLLEPDAEPQLQWTYWRWPRHLYSLGAFKYYPNLKLTIQWMVHEKVVLQQCLLENHGKDNISLDARFSKSMVIRDLDHINPESELNETSASEHDSKRGPQGYSWVCMHRFPGTTTGPINSTGVFVISSVAIDGEVKIFEDKTTSQTWHLDVKGRGNAEARGQPQTLQVITAYKMSHLDTREADWNAAIIPFENMNIDHFLRTQIPLCPLSLSIPASFEKTGAESERASEEFSPGDIINPPEDAASTERVYVEAPAGIPDKSSPRAQLEFAIRRNLEHILSVSTVRVPLVDFDTSADDKLPEELHERTLADALRNVDAVAFTCGDMSGHKICWSASFLPEEPYTNDVLSRINKTCLGHLKWLHLTKRQKIGPRFGPNYWVSGELMALPQSEHSWLADASLLDTAFQIMKAGTYMETQVEDENDVSIRLMSAWAPSWLASLDKLDKRRKYAWPHAEVFGVNTFRLDDNVWIWRALKALENRNGEAWNRMALNETFSNPLLKKDVAKLRKTLASEVVQREASKRFTTGNDILWKRKLAVTRSIRDTRFMLHARDTALFYNRMPDFFSGDNSTQGAWRRTAECQMYHEENYDLTWEKSLRYSLCIVMGTRGFRINNEAPDKLVRMATDVLLRSSSPNGLFPGRLQLFLNAPLQGLPSVTKSLYSYYHATFEIPYILLTHSTQVSEVYNRLAAPTTRVTKSEPSPDERLAQTARAQRPEPIAQSHQAQRESRRWPDDSEQRESTMKKSVPRNDLTDSSRISELEDEWLFNSPEFFDRETRLKDFDTHSAQIREELKDTAFIQESTSDRYVTARIDFDSK